MSIFLVLSLSNLCTPFIHVWYNMWNHIPYINTFPWCARGAYSTQRISLTKKYESDSPLEQNTDTAKQNIMVVLQYNMRKTKMREGSLCWIMAPLRRGMQKMMVIKITAMSRKMKYLVNQAVQWIQPLSPIIFIDSCNSKTPNDQSQYCAQNNTP